MLEPHLPIWTAIDDTRMLRFVYHGKERLVEPHDHGILNGSVQLLSWQVAGSSTRPLPNWLLTKVDENTDLVTLDQTFPGVCDRKRPTFPLTEPQTIAQLPSQLAPADPFAVSGNTEVVRAATMKHAASSPATRSTPFMHAPCLTERVHAKIRAQLDFCGATTPVSP